MRGEERTPVRIRKDIKTYLNPRSYISRIHWSSYDPISKKIYFIERGNLTLRSFDPDSHLIESYLAVKFPEEKLLGEYAADFTKRFLYFTFEDHIRRIDMSNGSVIILDNSEKMGKPTGLVLDTKHQILFVVTLDGSVYSEKIWMFSLITKDFGPVWPLQTSQSTVGNVFNLLYNFKKMELFFRWGRYLTPGIIKIKLLTMEFSRLDHNYSFCTLLSLDETDGGIYMETYKGVIKMLPNGDVRILPPTIGKSKIGGIMVDPKSNKLFYHQEDSNAPVKLMVDLFRK